MAVWFSQVMYLHFLHFKSHDLWEPNKVLFQAFIV
jgi:hypothetical protein